MVRPLVHSIRSMQSEVPVDRLWARQLQFAIINAMLQLDPRL